MRAAAAAALAVLLHAAPAHAQLLPTTTSTQPPSTEAPTTTEVPTTTSEAPTTTTEAPPETTAPRADPGDDPDEGREEPAATTAPPQTTTTFAIPAGREPAAEEDATGPLEADTGLLPFFVALSLGGLGVAVIIVGSQLVATRPRTRRSPTPRGGAPAAR